MASGKSSLRRLALTGSMAAVLAAGIVGAETYKIIDEKGRVQYTDRIPSDTVNRGMVELNKQGMPKNVTAPTLTPEQRRNEEEKAERQRQAERAAMQQRARETALLSSYTSETDIDFAKRRNLAIIGAAILSAEARIKALEKRSVALEREKQYYENQPIPDKLRREITSVAQEIPKQQELIAAKKEEALVVERKYSHQKERYLELKSQVARETSTRRLQ
jgi:uncharacterized protein DUF4124